mmetsp:Transcript_23259/g.42007  ORF Transcript_23259/g.42007 Transcript_23259/m.42007 type:complete len:261 (-) Transcript_23259:123-905(-)|eukprot:CAMPEP_0197634454 /NCGR_PEP_ID=MMETSP1338-20131121/10543_1 /TAXON_ID=43686 ORGANISM="Pelagodinium beii, Strain RCC1491" /NCGR_SAMPLE_ID=MMETSP1338 /ASSEMBLY_ACC=CAM_ASM_000754 /LENGTH=260 /DNA_ID=CAMNT_0043206321 /DNA_START=47 /DNA_END=829 /DNA_ORIENTATION=+
MGMLVNSYHPTESWAEVAAEAHLLVQQRLRQRPIDLLKDESRTLSDARPNPGGLPDNDLGPGQYTVSMALTSKTPCVPRIVKGDRFAKAGSGSESQLIKLGPDAWAESLSSRPLSPASMRQTGSSGFEAAGSTHGRSLGKNWRSKIQRPHHELVAEHQPDGELPITGEAAIPPGVKAKHDSFIRRKHPGLHSQSTGSLVRGNPRDFKSDRVDMSMLRASAEHLPSTRGLELFGSPAPGSPKKADLEKAKKNKKKKKSSKG